MEQWLESLTFILSERHFIIDYNSLHPVQDDIDLLTQMDLFVSVPKKIMIIRTFISYLN